MFKLMRIFEFVYYNLIMFPFMHGARRRKDDTILCYTILCCTKLYYSTLKGSVHLCYAIMCCTILYYTALKGSVHSEERAMSLRYVT